MSDLAELGFDKDVFLNANWRAAIGDNPGYGYSTVFQSLNAEALICEGNGDGARAECLRLLASTCSMMIEPGSINEPFKPRWQDFQEGKRSAIADDFTLEQLRFFESILKDIDEPWLKARLADLLWLCLRPRNPDHARAAINAYTSHPIDPETWLRDIDDCWERATRLCHQLRWHEKLEEIEGELYTAFLVDYPDSPFMHLRLAGLLKKLNPASDNSKAIAQRIFDLGSALNGANNFFESRGYFELAEKLYKKLKDDDQWLSTLILLAESHEKEGDSRVGGSQMAANSFYENAIQAYRKIPVKYRGQFNVDDRLTQLRDKLSKSGEGSLNEMGMFQTPSVDIRETIDASIEHVKGKDRPEVGLLFFTGFYGGPNVEELEVTAKEIVNHSPLSSLFGATHMSADGRVIGKTPAANLSASEDDEANQAILMRQLIQQFTIEIQLVVRGNILPALEQLTKEHRFSRRLLEDLCYHSPIVPEGRKFLVATALWFGFERDFSNAIHLLSPQLEHMVRCQLKAAGAHTSNVDKEGIENENGLSSLMDMPEAAAVFGGDLVFEIKAIFTESIGSNLRNEVAHGMLDDNSSSSLASVYAWWMLLRIVVRSIYVAVKEDAE